MSLTKFCNKHPRLSRFLCGGVPTTEQSCPLIPNYVGVISIKLRARIDQELQEMAEALKDSRNLESDRPSHTKLDRVAGAGARITILAQSNSIGDSFNNFLNRHI